MFLKLQPLTFFGGGLPLLRPHNISICVFEPDSVWLFHWKDVAVFVWLHHCKQVIAAITVTMQSWEGCVLSTMLGFLKHLPTTWEETLKKGETDWKNIRETIKRATDHGIHFNFERSDLKEKKQI